MPAEGASELFTFEGREGSGFKKVARIQGVAAAKVENGAVIVERSALGRHVDLGGRGSAELGVVNVGDDLEFLNQVDAGGEGQPAGAELDVLNSIDHDIGRLRADTIGRDTGPGVGEDAHLVLSIRDHARRQGRQLVKVPAVQGQFPHLGRVDDFAHRCMVGLDDGSHAFNRQFLGDLSHRQCDRNPCDLTHLQYDPGQDRGFEPDQ